MIIFEILLLIIMRAETASIQNIILLISLFTLTFLIYRIAFCVFIAKDAKDKNIGAKSTWVILSVIFGIILLPIYFIITHKSNHSTPDKKQKSKYILIILSVSFLIINIVSFSIFYNTNFTDYLNNIGLSDNLVTYENDYGEKVIYDKLGKEYTAENYNNILYYDAFGNSYITAADSGCIGYKCLETEKFYPSSSIDAIDIEKDYFVLKSFLINENGYVSIMDSENITYETNGIYSDSNNKYYYEPYLCNWDSNGNLVLSDSIKNYQNISDDINTNNDN